MRRMEGDTQQNDIQPVKKGYIEKLVNEYEKDDPSNVSDRTTEPIMESLNPVLQRCWWRMPAKEEIKKQMDKCARPNNCEAVKQVWVNDEIFEEN